MNIGPVQKSSAAGKVFDALYEMIASGQFKAGETLPSQDDLALRFGVSRNTLREAIHKLSAMGLLRPAQGVGTLVQPLGPAGLLDSLRGRLLLDSLTVREFVEARICVEKAVVRLAVSRSGPRDVQKLEEIIDSQRQACEKGDVQAFVRQDVAFHLELARMSGNRVLHKFLQTTWGMLHEFVAEVSQLPGAIEDAIRFHSKIAAAVAAKDAEKAEGETLRHLMDVVKRIERNVHVDLDVESLYGIEPVPSMSKPSRKPKARRTKKP